MRCYNKKCIYNVDETYCEIDHIEVDEEGKCAYFDDNPYLFEKRQGREDYENNE